MEPIYLLIDTIIKLTDRVINLEKTECHDKQLLFKEITKPLFEELEPIALNYINFFRNIRRAVNNGSHQDFQEFRTNIHKDHEAMLMSQIKIRAMIDQIINHINDNNLVEFTSAINNFFYVSTTDLTSDQEVNSAAFRLFKALESSAETHQIKQIKKSLERMINSDINYLEESWNTIVKSYEKNRILSVSPA